MDHKANPANIIYTPLVWWKNFTAGRFLPWGSEILPPLFTKFWIFWDSFRPKIKEYEMKSCSEKKIDIPTGRVSKWRKTKNFYFSVQW